MTMNVNMDNVVAQAKMQAEAARIRQEFARAVGRGDASVLDRFGRKITPGMLVIWKTAVDMLWTVVDVKPVMDPRMPAGLIEVVLRCESSKNFFQANSTSIEMVIVGEGKPVPAVPAAATLATEPPAGNSTSNETGQIDDPKPPTDDVS